MCVLFFNWRIGGFNENRHLLVSLEPSRWELVGRSQSLFLGHWHILEENELFSLVVQQW